MDYEAFMKKIKPDDVVKIVCSNGGRDVKYRRIAAIKKENGYQLEKYTDKQVFHENVTQLSPESFTKEALKDYRQIDLFTEQMQYTVKQSKKGRLMFGSSRLAEQTKVTQTHNRKKHYLLQEGQVIEPLVYMGIFTQEGRVVRSMYDKFKQINRFLELIDDAVDENTKSCNIIDFGCGKSYLTFIVYYYFTYIRKIPVQIIGLDLKEDVIKHCNEAAERYGYDKLHFTLGDINGYQAPFPVDMVLTLHACDTATDYALYNAIQWKAKMIFSVPCCQHELNGQLKSEEFAILERYGIVKERFAALATDAIRGSLLECCGYKTQLLEFVDLSHTPKNILIRAVRKPVVVKAVKEKRLAETEALMKEFHFEPTLYRLLSDRLK